MKDQDSSQTSLLQEWIQENDAHLNDVIHHSDKGLIPLLRRSFFFIDQINIKNQDFLNLLQVLDLGRFS